MGNEFQLNFVTCRILTRKCVEYRDACLKNIIVRRINWAMYFLRRLNKLLAVKRIKEWMKFESFFCARISIWWWEIHNFIIRAFFINRVKFAASACEFLENWDAWEMTHAWLYRQERCCCRLPNSSLTNLAYRNLTRTLARILGIP